MINLTPEQLWEAIYASRMAERYWKGVRIAQPSHYTADELDRKVQEQKQTTKMLENLAPVNSW